MKMLMAVVPRDEAERVLEALVTAGFTATFTDSRGGMLRQAQQMLFIAAKDEDLDQVLAIIRGSCHSQVYVGSGESEGEALSPRPAAVTAELGGAVVFVWDLDRLEVY
jgi:uncharacterized protein YaaQ